MARHEVRVADPDDRRVPGRGRTTPSAEFAGRLLWDALVHAVRRGALVSFVHGVSIY